MSKGWDTWLSKAGNTPAKKAQEEAEKTTVNKIEEEGGDLTGFQVVRD